MYGSIFNTTGPQRNVFSSVALNQTTTIGLATTYVGLCLSNPNGSSVLLVPNLVGYAFTVAFTAAAVVGLMVGTSGSAVTHTQSISPRNNYIGGTAGIGLTDSSATLPVAPTLQMVLADELTGAITTAPASSVALVYLYGSFILPPGSFMAFYTSTASGASGASFSIQWEEVPLQ
jgi:hypothetical protein